jgi:hypothetical protein
MGADQHITDPEDRAELVVLAYTLYGQHGSLRKVREHLAMEPATLRITGERRLFSIDTIRTFIDEGRTADQYVELLNIARERVDSNTRLSLLASMAWDVMRTSQAQTVTEKIQTLDFMRKIERDRMDLLGLKAPIKVQQVGDQTGAPPDDLVPTIEALARKAEQDRQALVDDAYPGATVVPVAPRKRRSPGERRTS